MMPFRQQKNSALANRRLARHEREIRRLTGGSAAGLWDYFTRLVKMGSGAAANAVASAQRAIERAYRKHYNLRGAYHPHAGQQEILRAQLGGFHHDAVHVNRKMVIDLGHSQFPQFLGPARPTKREIIRRCGLGAV